MTLLGSEESTGSMVLGATNDGARLWGSFHFGQTNGVLVGSGVDWLDRVGQVKPGSFEPEVVGASGVVEGIKAGEDVGNTGGAGGVDVVRVLSTGSAVYC